MRQAKPEHLSRNFVTTECEPFSCNPPESEHSIENGIAKIRSLKSCETLLLWYHILK